ncbi:hypothetical protein ACHHYP_01322 [Achlya hypogyna]|uniref:BEACH domain-containing protein n=1 Tax=Achlya hypogyna TaxID=1202772 RepID=A0A1V9Z8R2_ACHHY|nr:hypothetical protein ACHHYP_01322 [Achlya hypogyna]
MMPRMKDLAAACKHLSDVGAVFCEQTNFPALVAEALDQIRLHYVVAHVAAVGGSEAPIDTTVQTCISTLGTCLIALCSNPRVMETYRCELGNLLRLVAELYTPAVDDIRSFVASAIGATTLTAGAVWYLHDSRAVAACLSTMRQLAAATAVTPDNAAAAVSTLHLVAREATAPVDAQLAVSRALGLAHAAEAPVDELRPPEHTYTLASHRPAIGLAALVGLVSGSTKHTPVLLQDFAAARGYEQLWCAHRTSDAAAALALFHQLLAVGDGPGTVRNDVAVVALKDYLVESLGSPERDTIELYRVLGAAYTGDVATFTHLEPRTHVLASLVSKLPSVPVTAQPSVLAAVEAIGTADIALVGDIVSVLCAHGIDASAQEIERPIEPTASLALLVCASLRRLLVAAPDASALRACLVDCGLVDRGLAVVLAATAGWAPAALLPVQALLQAWAELATVLLPPSPTAVARYRASAAPTDVIRLLDALLLEPPVRDALAGVVCALAPIDATEHVQSDLAQLLQLCEATITDAARFVAALSLLRRLLATAATVSWLFCHRVDGVAALVALVGRLPATATTIPALDALLAGLTLVWTAAEAAASTAQQGLYDALAAHLRPWLAVDMPGLLVRVLALAFEQKPEVAVHNAPAAAVVFALLAEPTVQASWLDTVVTGVLAQLPLGAKAAVVRAGVFQWILPLVAAAPEPACWVPLLRTLAAEAMAVPQLRDCLRSLNALPPAVGLPLLETLVKVPAVPHVRLPPLASRHFARDKVWPPPSGYSVACWLQFEVPPAAPPRKSHTTSLVLCEGAVHIDGVGDQYAVLVGPTLTLYSTKADAVAGGPETAAMEIADVVDVEDPRGFGFVPRGAARPLEALVETDANARMWRAALAELGAPRSHVALLSLYATDSCYCRVYFDGVLRVETASPTKRMTVVFKNVDVGLFSGSWHHIVLTHRKSVVGSSVVTLYIDGAEVTSKKLHYPATPTPTPLLCILGADPTATAAAGPTLLLGHTWLLADVLPPVGASVFFMLGPGFGHRCTGNASAFGALHDWTEAVFTHFLHRLAGRRVDVARAAKRLGLTRCLAAAQADWAPATAEDEDALPAEVAFRDFIEATCKPAGLGRELLQLVASFKWPSDLVLYASSLEAPPETHVPLDLPRLLPSLGGLPVVLLPWLRLVTTTDELCCALRAIVRCLKQSAAVLAAFLEAHGHYWLAAFTVAHQSLLDDRALQVLCKTAVSGALKLDEARMPLAARAERFPYPVVVDGHALAQVVLNPVVRAALAPRLQGTLVRLLSYTLHVANPNALFNARQLRQAGLVPWLLGYVAQLCRNAQPPPLVDALVALYLRFVAVEAHVDDVLSLTDRLLMTLADAAHGPALRRRLLEHVLAHLDVLGRTLVDAVMFRLQSDRRTKGVTPLPQWYLQGAADRPVLFSADGLEAVLLEVLVVVAPAPAMPPDALLAERVLLSLAQVQPAFGAHLLAGGPLARRLQQALALHRGHLPAFVPLLALVALIPLAAVRADAPSLADAFPEPSRYTPVAMDRVCVDAVWELLGQLWAANQASDTASPTALASLRWLTGRLEADALVFQALCRSSSRFLPAVARCVVALPDALVAADTVSYAAAACLEAFLQKALLERDDWPEHMLLVLDKGLADWLALLLRLVDATAMLTTHCSIVAMKNLCGVFLGLLRVAVADAKGPKKGCGIRAIGGAQGYVTKGAWTPRLTVTVATFLVRALGLCNDAAQTPVLGAGEQQYFYGLLVFALQGFVLQGLYHARDYGADHAELMALLVAHKELLLQHTKGSCVLVYGALQGGGDAVSLGFRLHMRQLSLTSHQKELWIGPETDKTFAMCLATQLFRMLLDATDTTSFAAVQLMQFLIQQRPVLVRDLLVVEPKATLLSAPKKDGVDLFHGGMDQVLAIDTPTAAAWPVFSAWLAAHFPALTELLPARTDPLFDALVDVLENALAVRKGTASKVEVAIHVPLDGPPPAPLAGVIVGAPEPGLAAAARLLVATAEQQLQQVDESMREAGAQWATPEPRSLWLRPVVADPSPTAASVCQATWLGPMMLDATEGPGRMRRRLKPREATALPPPPTAPSLVPPSLALHDLIEVYRQVQFRATTAEAKDVACKYSSTRDRLQALGRDLTPASVAEVIVAFIAETSALGVSAAVLTDIQSALTDAAPLPSTLFDMADSEAMQRSLLCSRGSGVIEDDDGANDDEKEDRPDVTSDGSDDDDEDRPSAPSVDMDVGSPRGGLPDAPDRASYGSILRYLHRHDQVPLRCCNAGYLTGMTKALGVMVFCREALYFIEGYVAVDGASEVATKRKTQFQVFVDLTADVLKAAPRAWRIVQDKPPAHALTKWRLPYGEIRQFYRMKYQLRPVGLEFVATHGGTFFCAFESVADRNEAFKALFTMPIHNSIYWAHVLRPGPLGSTKRLRQGLTKQWLRGSLSNFEYLVELNAMAGRSFNDLTQYPIFPWVLADYTSPTLDLTNVASYRDLAKPMGALGASRALQFQERFQAMSADGFDAPAFHYGTHYSCSAYVTYYLLRLEPFSAMAKELQGGDFDKADRLFRSIGASWASASAENLQDVRELIPEFFFLPEFLVNANKYALGTTQSGAVVDDVLLPPWARGDPREFVRLHRQALESKFVSENLHQWIDLIFGYKQRGPAAVEAQNVFMHMTYEGTIDLDAIDDPVLREATLAQIENFGQTPSKLFNSPHPQRKVPSLHGQSHSSLMAHAHDLSLNTPSSIEAYLKWHTPLAPSLVSIGKEFVHLKKASCAAVLPGEPIGDVQVAADKVRAPTPVVDSRRQVLCRGLTSVLVPPRLKKYVDFGTAGVLVLRSLPKSKALFVVEDAHIGAIRCAAFAADGLQLATGGDDGVVNLMGCVKVHGARQFHHKGKLAGHDDAVLCVAIDPAFNIVLSGSRDLTAIVWDLRSQSYLRELGGHATPLLRVGINSTNGNLMTATADELRLWSINGDLLACAHLPALGLPPLTVAVMTRCDVWQAGVVVVTGHANGTIACWGLQYPSDASPDAKKDEPSEVSVRSPRQLKPMAVANEEKATPSCRLYVMKLLLEHRAAVTALVVTPDQRQLISGDADGFCTRWHDDSYGAIPFS